MTPTNMLSGQADCSDYDQIMKCLSDEDQAAYKTVILFWNNWSENRIELMKGIESNWHVRFFTPKHDRQMIDLDNSVPPQGDTVFWVRIDRSRQYELANKTIQKLKEYVNKKSSTFEPPLRIRSIVFQTVEAYMEDLKEETNVVFGRLGDMSLDKEERSKHIHQLKNLKEEWRETIDAIKRTIDSVQMDPGLNKNESLLRCWEDLFNECLSFNNKIHGQLYEKNDEKARVLVKQRMGYNE